MTIRFPCGACTQPIEIDDEWASKQAACPYCRKTITVPAQSTLTDLAAIPMAKFASVESAAGWPPPPPIASARRESPNHLAIVAAVLAGTTLILLILFGVIMSAHSEALQAVARQAQERIESGEPWMTAVQKPWASLAEEEGGFPPDWVIAFVLLEMSLLVIGLAAFACSVIACFRPRRRGLAIAALVVTCILPFITCGVMGSVMGV